ncbi:MAG: flagellar filament capping protein FliD [Chloroflexi bacterium]|nr:flagellar filament capping protein FliD [Chloroflexota bacterium]
MSSTFAVSGLASGLDTASIIEKLMQIESSSMTKVQGQQTAHTSKMSAIASIKDLITSLQGTARTLSDRSRMNAKMASTDTASDSPTVLTASTSADAINGSFKVTVSQLATSTRIYSNAAMGNVIDHAATLANAGFRYSVNTGTFRINGQQITVDNTTTLDSMITAINGSGAGVTASLVADADGRADNRVQIISAPGQSLQLGSLSDTANALRLMNLSDAVVSGYTAASTNSGMAASAGALNTSITINGVTTTINQGNAGFSDVQNAQFIAQEINNNSSSTVSAVAQGDGTITLTQKTAGGSQAIAITAAGTGTGLTAGTVQNGTDRVVSSTGLGVTNVGAALGTSRLATPIAGLDGSGNGKFTINDVEISYKATDSITTIVNRINSSSAGVSAFYDPVQDRLRFAASQTGARTMTLSDTQGNFLAATGVLAGTQQLGQNALFSIDTVNNGQQLTSSTNSISGYLPGVTLDLKSTSANPVTVTVSQDANSTINTIKAFVNQYNTVMTKIEDLTKYDSTNKKASALTGDLGMREIQRSLRQMVSTAAQGASGTYRTLASIGVSFGAFGSSVGATSKLVVDDAKLSKALSENPQAVESIIAGFGATLSAPTTNNISAVTGTPEIHQDGTFHVKVTNAASGEVEAWFTNSSGQKTWSQTGAVAAGQDNYGIIPGLKITTQATLTDGQEDTFTVSVSNKGIGVMLNDYINGLTDSVTGYFATRKKGDDSINDGYTKRIDEMQRRLELKKTSLEKKYAALETTMSKLQSQSSSLSAQLAKLNSSSS